MPGSMLYYRPKYTEEDYIREMELNRLRAGGVIEPINPQRFEPVPRVDEIIANNPYGAGQPEIVPEEPPAAPILRKDYDAEADSARLHYAPDYESPIDQTANSAGPAMKPEWFDYYMQNAERRGGFATLAGDGGQDAPPVDVAVPTAELPAPPEQARREPPIIDVTGPTRREVTPVASQPEVNVRSATSALERHQAPPAAYAPPDLRNESERIVDTRPGTGERGNFYGYEDEFRVEREERMRMAADAYDRLPTEQTRVDYNWTDEYLRSRPRMDGNDIRRDTLITQLLRGPEAAAQFRKDAIAERRDYDKGLEHARAMDAGEMRVPKSLAVAIAASGMVDPESAAALRMNSPEVQAWRSGGYAQMGRTDSLLERQRQFDIRTIQQQSMQNQQQWARSEEGYKNRIAKLEMMSTLKSGNPQTQAIKTGAMAKWIIEHAPKLHEDPKLAWEIAKQFAATGDVNALPEPFRTPQLEKLWIEAGTHTLTNTGPQTLTPAPTAERKETERKASEPYDTSNQNTWSELRDLRFAVNEARQAWNKMSPTARADFVQFGMKTPESVADYKSLAQYSSEVAALHRLKNRIIAQEAGKGQTVSEVQNQLQGLAITRSDYWNGFRDPKGFEDALRSLEQKTQMIYVDGKRRHRW